MATKMSGPGLAQLARLVKRAPEIIRREAAKEVKKAVRQLIREEFKERSDPYGHPWKPPKDGGRPMQRTGNLKNGFLVDTAPTSEGISIQVGNEMPYIKWLQEGTAQMEARKTVPVETLPDTWRARFVECYQTAFLKWFSKLGPS